MEPSDKNNGKANEDNSLKVKTNSDEKLIGVAIDDAINNRTINNEIDEIIVKKRKKFRLIKVISIFSIIILISATAVTSYLLNIQQKGIDERREKAAKTVGEVYSKIRSVDWPYDIVIDKEPYDAKCVEYKHKFETNDRCYYRATIALSVPYDEYESMHKIEAINRTGKPANLDVQDKILKIYQKDMSSENLSQAKAEEIISKNSDTEVSIFYNYDENTNSQFRGEEFIKYNNEIKNGKAVVIINISYLYDSEYLRAIFR